MARFRYTGSRANAGGLRALRVTGVRDLDRRAARVESVAKELVGVDSGRLRASIRRERGTGYVDVVAGRNGRTPYTMPHHDGSPPHIIRVKNRKALRWYVNGQARFAKFVRHPGTKATRFLTRALRAGR